MKHENPEDVITEYIDRLHTERDALIKRNGELEVALLEIGEAIERTIFVSDLQKNVRRRNATASFKAGDVSHTHERGSSG